MIKLVIILSLASVLVVAALVAAPVVFGVVAGGGVSVAMLVCIYQIVRSDRLSARLPEPPATPTYYVNEIDFIDISR